MQPEAAYRVFEDMEQLSREMVAIGVLADFAVSIGGTGEALDRVSAAYKYASTAVKFNDMDGLQGTSKRKKAIMALAQKYGGVGTLGNISKESLEKYKDVANVVSDTFGRMPQSELEGILIFKKDASSRESAKLLTIDPTARIEFAPDLIELANDPRETAPESVAQRIAFSTLVDNHSLENVLNGKAFASVRTANIIAGVIAAALTILTVWHSWWWVLLSLPACIASKWLYSDLSALKRANQLLPKFATTVWVPCLSELKRLQIVKNASNTESAAAGPTSHKAA